MVRRALEKAATEYERALRSFERSAKASSVVRDIRDGFSRGQQWLHFGAMACMSELTSRIHPPEEARDEGARFPGGSSRDEGMGVGIDSSGAARGADRQWEMTVQFYEDLAMAATRREELRSSNLG